VKETIVHFDLWWVHFIVLVSLQSHQQSAHKG